MEQAPWTSLREVTVGGYGDPRELIAAVRAAGAFVTDFVKADMFRTAFPLLGEPVKLRLVRTTVGRLGFGRGSPYDAVFAWASARAMVCPLETSMGLRRVYVNQPKGERLIVVTPPMEGFNRTPTVYAVENVANVPKVHFKAVPDEVSLSPGTELVLQLPA